MLQGLTSPGVTTGAPRVRHGWHYFRRYGVGRTLRTLIQRYVWCRDEWVVVKATLAGPPVDDHVGDVTFRLVIEPFQPGEIRGRMPIVDSFSARWPRTGATGSSSC